VAYAKFVEERQTKEFANAAVIILAKQYVVTKMFFVENVKDFLNLSFRKKPSDPKPET
jgi:hypothetical protein